MSTVIERLMSGDKDIVRQCVATKSYWDEFFRGKKNLSISELAKALEMALFSFKKIFGDDYPFAKEMMPLTCLGSLYNDGFEDKSFVEKVVRAFERSALPGEVKKAYLKAAVKYYDLSITMTATRDV